MQYSPNQCKGKEKVDAKHYTFGVFNGRTTIKLYDKLKRFSLQKFSEKHFPKDRKKYSDGRSYKQIATQYFQPPFKKI